MSGWLLLYINDMTDKNVYMEGNDVEMDEIMLKVYIVHS